MATNRNRLSEILALFQYSVNARNLALADNTALCKRLGLRGYVNNDTAKPLLPGLLWCLNALFVYDILLSRMIVELGLLHLDHQGQTFSPSSSLEAARFQSLYWKLSMILH
ncbi:hypothetical protein CIHG_06171 [Coccidioides immitis H538.4]|uniref:Uncharacterized protein n=1 Tax=Coccidioides immitis H538.4 TaxID=396776 RepID=A0A0J8ULF2_COCIT|nr:hypothetical protein CIHG_06171 [Coccidioides immitis H538.4]